VKRVVITGLGVASPLGIGRDAFWSNLMAGRSGIGPITLFDASSFPVRIGGEVKGLDIQSVMDPYPQFATIKDRKVPLALAAAEEAIAHAGLSGDCLQDALLFVGVGLEAIGLEDLTACANPGDQGRTIANSLLEQAGGAWLQTPLDCATDILGRRYGFRAGKYTNCSACVAGAQAIGQAWQLLREGAPSIALAGAADSMLNPLGLGGFSLLGVLSNENDRPQTACRPFDATRKGTVLGEGAAFLVLEALDSATARKAAIYAEVMGYGSTLDAFSVSDPDPSGKGAVQSMNAALEEAGLHAGEIDCVNAHGTGTIKNDIVETAAIKEAFGDHAYRMAVHSVKSMTGHLIAASGAVEAVAAAMTLYRKRIPPTINLRTRDVECDLDYVAEGPREFAGNTVLSNSFGFGGQNATLIFRRHG
jgi:3-oxoacyl-[acyl-carrier-protein] synthase II